MKQGDGIWMCPAEYVKNKSYISQGLCTYANFGHPLWTFHAYRGTWCTSCFKTHHLDCFGTAVPWDFHGASLAEVEDGVNFRMTRPVDQLRNYFQCPNCQSQNIRGHDLDTMQVVDDVFEFTCIRATLDAFWARASRTVLGHVLQVIFMKKCADLLDIAYPFPCLDHLLLSIMLIY